MDHVLGGGDYARLATVYVALYTSDPGDAGAANTNETTGTSYARVPVTNDAAHWPAASGGVKSNGQVIDFGTVGAGGWGTVTYWAIVSTASGAGNILFSGPLNASHVLAASDTFQFGIGAITITAD